MLSNIILLLLKSPPHFLFPIPQTHPTTLFAFLNISLIRISFVECATQLVYSFYFPSFPVLLILFTLPLFPPTPSFSSSQQSLPAFSSSHTFPGSSSFLHFVYCSSLYLLNILYQPFAYSSLSLFLSHSYT
jgi:hypothetical protein